LHEFSVLFSYVGLAPEFCIYLSDTLNMLMDRQVNIMKIAVSWDVTPCGLIYVCWHGNQWPPPLEWRV